MWAADNVIQTEKGGSTLQVEIQCVFQKNFSILA